jgi:hypothetical protein
MVMTHRWKYVLAAVALATVMAGLPVASEAKGKGIVTATVNGKHVRWRGRLLSFTQSDSGLIIIGTKFRAAKTIGIGCPILLSAYTYPTTFDTYCSGQYAEHGGKRYWFNTGLSADPFQVTFDSFDGTVVEGHFSGTLPPLVGATSPVTLEGSFRGVVNGQ